MQKWYTRSHAHTCNLCICMYVYMYMIVHMHTCTHTCTCSPPPSHSHTYTHAHTLTYSYFVSVMEGVTSLSTALARGNIIALTNVFVLRQSPHQLSLVPSSSESSGGGGGPPSLAPVEEAQLLLSIQSHMEGIPRLEMRYCLLDALFGGPALEV